MEEKNIGVSDGIKKKKIKFNFINLIVIILIIVSCLLIINGVYNIFKGKGNTGKEESSKVKKIERFDLTEEESKKYDDIVRVLSNNFAKYYESGFDKIPNQELLYFALEKNNFKENISKKEVEDVIKKYFGSSKSVTHEDLKCLDDEEILYTLKGNNYEKNTTHSIHTDLQKDRAYPLHMSGSNKKGIIMEYYYVLFNDECSDTCPLYGTVNKHGEALLNIEALDGVPNDEKVYTVDNTNEVDERLPVTVFKFETKNGELIKINDIHLDD